MSEKYDAIVIGTGQAGPALAVRLGKAGRKTAIIERKLIGGTCVNNGCIPTKTLIASARAAYIARRGADFGVMIDSPIRVDMPRVKARKDAVVGQSNNGVTKWLEGTANVTLIRGHARFEGPRSVRVNDTILEAGEIFINVGGRANVPDMPGLRDVPFLTNSSMMDVDFLPEHLLIVGGSYIGLEFMQMSCEEEPREIVGSHLLLAIGRVPNTDDLGLDKAGVKTNAKGFIEVDDQCRTNVPGIWALGDANGRGAFTHTSYNDYEIVAANLLDNDPRRISDRITTYALFVDPPLGRCGMTEREVRATGKKALVGKMMMTRVGRARERSETQGFMQVLVDADTKRILGAALLGTEGDEAVHCILDLMSAGAPYTTLQRTVHIHPTVSELIPTLLGDLKPVA